MHFTTSCIWLFLILVGLGLGIFFGFVRRPSPLDRIVAAFRREKADANAKQELRELADKLKPPDTDQ